MSDIKESLNKSRLTAQHLSRLPFFCHLVQKALDNRQAVCDLFAQPDEKNADAIQTLDLISASLTGLPQAHLISIRICSTAIYIGGLIMICLTFP